jgi:hypothetical protein
MAESTPLLKSSTPRAIIRAAFVEHVNKEMNAALSGKRNLSKSVGWTIKAITEMDREVVLEAQKEKKKALLMLEEAALMKDEALKIEQEVKEELEIARKRDEESKTNGEASGNYRCDDDGCLVCMFADEEVEADDECDENCLMCKAWED